MENIGQHMYREQNKKRIFVLIAMFVFGIGFAHAESFFENFSDDPTTGGWVDAGNTRTVFNYNAGGWLDASIKYDFTGVTRYYIPLAQTYDKTTEFFAEMDIEFVSATDLQQCLFGVFNSAFDSVHNVVADQFFYDNLSGTDKGNRCDLTCFNSASTDNKISISGTFASGVTEIPYAVATRAKLHYWYDGSVGKGTLKIYQINPDGSDGNLLLSAGPSTILNSGAALAFNIFGIANRTEGSVLGNAEVVKVDNLYFSTYNENYEHEIPSFMQSPKPGDFEPDGDIDLDDLAVFVSQWLNICNIPDWCSGADFNQSARVDLNDFSQIAKNWLDQVPTGNFAVIKDIAYLTAGRSEKLDLYYNPSALPGQRFPGIVIIHGGGWTGGDKAGTREVAIANFLVPAGYVCVSINYKLGSTSWPTNIQDCKNAVAFLRTYADTYHIDTNNIGVIGGSAGGHLVSMMGVTDSSQGLEPASPYPGVSTRVGAVVDMYGITDLWTRCETADGTPIPASLKDGTAPTMLGCGRTVCPALWTLASPVEHVTADDPPVLIMHGTKDTTVDYNQSIELDNVLKAAGVYSDFHLIPGLSHSFTPSISNGMQPEVITFFDAFLK
jgi:acetyl esterase/lipase